MRSDLNKQLCERERIGHSKRYRQRRHTKRYNPLPGEEGENLRSREGIKFRYQGGDKSFNENLSPLRGQVRKAIGSRWDSFYSEFCKNFDKRSVINQHILQHLEDFCERNIIIKDGELYVRGNYSLHDQLLRNSTVEIYVDPQDGIIKRNKHYKTYKQREREVKAKTIKKLAKTERWIDDNNVLRLIDGVWYHFTLKDIPHGSMVYTKPLDKELFILNKFDGEGRPWHKLLEYEKQKIGIPRFEGGSAQDIFFNERVYFDGKYVQALSYSKKGLNGWSYKPFSSKKYHALKKTASHKMLKKIGIVSD